MSSRLCVDCSANTTRMHEYYMLRDEVWLQTGLGFADGRLCIGCVEKRIGRELHPSDFTDCRINRQDSPYGHSKRLRKRLGFEVTAGATESRVNLEPAIPARSQLS